MRSGNFAHRSKAALLVLVTLGVILGALVFSGCNSAGDIADVTDVVVNPPSRKEIDRTKLGVTNFFSNTRTFGSVEEQFRDIKQNLGIRYVRVLIPWTDSLQPAKNSAYNYSAPDAVIRSIPAGVDVLFVLAHTPNWFVNAANRESSNAREAWVEQFLKPTVERYSNVPGVVGFEIFNEPDVVTVPSDQVLELTSAENYVELLRISYGVIKEINSSKLAVMAATRSIQQNWPASFNYNKALKQAGAANYTDVWNIHYYGKQFEKVVAPDGVADFLKGVGKAIWVTESGIKGPNNQLAYVQTVWPFLDDKISGIQRFYYYEYSSTAAAPESFGMRSNDQAFPVSDLYVELIKSE